MLSHRGEMSPALRLLSTIGALALVLPMGCEAGEIELRGAPPQILVGSGGDVGSGGMIEEPPPAETGGIIQNVGGDGFRPDPFPEQPQFWPCLVTQACFAFCDGGFPGCLPCEFDEQCPEGVRLCDGSLDRCVECLDDRDCVETYGPAFGECSSGMCVQCQRDEHCPPGIRCDYGWCGRCEYDFECPLGMSCFRDHCVPDP